MWEKIEQVWKIKEVRNNLLFVLAMLVIFRLASHIPVPGVNVANLRDYHSRWAFLSVGGLDPRGATNTNQLVVESERAMIEQTENAVILADHSKWDHRDMIRQCDWSEISCLITDQKPDGWTPPIAPENLVVASPVPP